MRAQLFFGEVLPIASTPPAAPPPVAPVEAPPKASRFKYQISAFLQGEDRARLEAALIAPVRPVSKAKIMRLDRHGRAHLQAQADYRKTGKWKVVIFYVNQADEECYCESASMAHSAASKLAHDTKGAIVVMSNAAPSQGARLVIFPSQVYTIAVEERQAA